MTCPDGSEPLSAQQLYGYASAAGFVGNALDTIVAIALRESSGCAGITNPNAVIQGGVDYGQAQGILQFLPGTFAGSGVAGSPYDPQAAFEAAYEVSGGGTNFGPWTCDSSCGPNAGVVPTSPQNVFTSAGQSIADLYPEIFGGSSGGSASPSVDITGTVASGISGFLSGAFKNWQQDLANIGVGAVGLVILLGGLIILAAPQISNVVQQAGKDAG